MFLGPPCYSHHLSFLNVPVDCVNEKPWALEGMESWPDSREESRREQSLRNLGFHHWLASRIKHIFRPLFFIWNLAITLKKKKKHLIGQPWIIATLHGYLGNSTFGSQPPAKPKKSQRALSGGNDYMAGGLVNELRKRAQCPFELWLTLPSRLELCSSWTGSAQPEVKR